MVSKCALPEGAHITHLHSYRMDTTSVRFDEPRPMTWNIARYSSKGMPSPERLQCGFSVFRNRLSTMFALVKLGWVPLIHIASGVHVLA